MIFQGPFQPGIFYDSMKSPGQILPSVLEQLLL